MDAQEPSLDLILAGGRTIDPASGIDAVMDVGIAEGRIAQVAPSIPASSARQVVDVSGLLVTPGLIDIHTHVYVFAPTPDYYVEGVRADAHLLASGVTTTVDAGTAGWQHFSEFYERCISRSTVRILTLINVASGGMVHCTTEQEPAHFHPRLAAAVAEAYPEVVVGIKSAHYWTRQPWDDAHPPWASVDAGLETGALCGKPLMVDFWPRPPERPYPELLARLRPGDMHTHMFAQQFPLFDEGGRVREWYWRARERGVLFDVGHGATWGTARGAFGSAMRCPRSSAAFGPTRSAPICTWAASTDWR